MSMHVFIGPKIVRCCACASVIAPAVSTLPKTHEAVGAVEVGEGVVGGARQAGAAALRSQLQHPQLHQQGRCRAHSASRAAQSEHTRHPACSMFSRADIRLTPWLDSWIKHVAIASQQVKNMSECRTCSAVSRVPPQAASNWHVTCVNISHALSMLLYNGRLQSGKVGAPGSCWW